MSTRQMRKRIEKLTEQTSPTDGLRWSGTLEDLRRLMWRQDKQGFIKIANEKGSMYRSFVDQFEREDAELTAWR